MPMAPAWMSTRSDCAKTASPVVNVERSGASAAAENEKPGLSVRFQAPGGVWRQIDLFEHEMRIGNEKRPFVGEPVRLHLEIGRSGVRNRHCVFDMKFTLPAVIEQTKRRVAALLDFRNDEPRANRVDRPGGHEDDVARRHGPPHDKIRDRAVVDRLTQLLRSHALLQAERDLGFGSSTQDVPGFGFAVRQAHRMRKRIVRMNLDGKRLAREQQLEQERRICGRLTGSLVPDFADRAAVMARVAPRTQICNTPRLW